MDFVEVAVVTSPFANLAPLYEVDPDADVLLIVPPSGQPSGPRNELRVNGVSGEHKTQNATTTSIARSGLRIKVSSRHLALASHVFKNKLQFGTTKATRQSDGRVHLKLAEGFDPKAVSIAMNAIHSRGAKVPKAVDLETLAHIAVFVDRFQLYDAVEVYAERWISHLERTTPDTFNHKPIPWIYISHVFRHPDIFKTATKLAALQSSGPIHAANLPIREKIIHHIDTQRQTLLSRALTLLHGTLDDLTSGAAPCTTHHCDALLLGGLIKSLHKQQLVWLRPMKPFPDLSFGDVIRGVKEGLVVYQDQVQRDLERQEEDRRRREREVEVEVEPWYMKSVRSNNVNGDRVKEGPRPGWGVVGGIFPITPAASPEPVYRNGDGGGRVEGHGHDCEARGAVAGLEGLERLADGVEGLVLEGRLGYLLY
ncbi:hypothetical protein C8A01DRAFT_20505 [Parachaetomium inaequale]|uniref:BTB domain-containing protein n=1 Tax=Parachaetomium inaequale TaxID=2588326 RepID=A0AAN6SMC0_9PEZI|nr:hypothetical protein C8A01DRAFT_20505 [Parachaetomium inaequale]